jgi:hypothetical protein
VIGTVLTHLIGWPLIPLNFQRQRFEADFRFLLYSLMPSVTGNMVTETAKRLSKLASSPPVAPQ